MCNRQYSIFIIFHHHNIIVSNEYSLTYYVTTHRQFSETFHQTHNLHYKPTGKTNFSLMVVLGDQHCAPNRVPSVSPHIAGVYEGVAPFTCAHYFRRSTALMFKVKMPPSHKVFIFTFASLGTVQHT